MSVPTVRALAAQDATPARALVELVYRGTRHEARTHELLALALTGDDLECEGLVAVSGGGSVHALVLYGSIGGAAGVVKLHALLGTTTDALAALVSRLHTVFSEVDPRIVICELSDETEHAPASTALTALGFTREARIADYFADGVALEVLVFRQE